MKAPGVVITCLKPTCGRQEEIECTGLRDMGGGRVVPVSGHRPAGWIGGPAGEQDVQNGLCPEHAAEFSAAVKEFLAKDTPPPVVVPPPKQVDYVPAKCDPIANTLMQAVEDSTRPPIHSQVAAGPVVGIAQKGETLKPQRIEPQIQTVGGSTGCSYPAPLPSKPIMQSFQSQGPTVAQGAGAISAPPPSSHPLGVHTKSAAMPNRIDCSPTGAGVMKPAVHNFTANSAPHAVHTGAQQFTPVHPSVAQAAGAGPGGSSEVSYSPFQPVPAGTKAP